MNNTNIKANRHLQCQQPWNSNHGNYYEFFLTNVIKVETCTPSSPKCGALRVNKCILGLNNGHPLT
jgi:hypothetical protein